MNPKILLLIKESREGKRKAIEELIKETQKDLWKTSYFMIGNAQSAEDVLQDAYVQIINKFSDLKDNEKFIPWAKAIVRNLCLDFIRREKKIKSESIAEGDHSEFYTSGFEFESKEWIQKVLFKFDPEDRWLIISHYIEGMTYEELSQILGIKSDALRARVSRLKPYLIEYIENNS